MKSTRLGICLSTPTLVRSKLAKTTVSFTGHIGEGFRQLPYSFGGR